MIVRPTRTEVRSPASARMSDVGVGTEPIASAMDVELRIDRLIVERPLLGGVGAGGGRRFEAALTTALERRFAACGPTDGWERAAAEAQWTLRLPPRPEADPEALAEALASALASALLPGGFHAPAQGRMR